MTEPWLSKSRYLQGLQCEKRLWLGALRPDLATPREPGLQALLEMGSAVGRAAQALFAGGVRVDEPSDQHAIAQTRTRTLLLDPGVPAIFEAAFEHRGVRVRVDVLERLGPGCFGLREVKSAASVKNEHLHDLAIQLWVLDGCGLDVPSAELLHVDSSHVRGLDVPSAELLHVDSSHVRGEGDIDWRRYFVREDRTAAARILAGDCESRATALLQVLARNEPPEVEPDGHCSSPYACEFWAHCTAGKPPEWFLSRKRLREEQRTRWLEALRTGHTWVSADLAGRLSGARPPVWHLDFEALAPAIPIYPGTRPFEAIAFQWSLHRWQPGGPSLHREFLADGHSDPRPAVAESLLAALGGDADPIVVYSPYERRILCDLAQRVPERAAELGRLRHRLIDLLPVVRSSVYHPGFRGSFSLKAVGPALAPRIRYDDLAGVADGTAAAAAFARIAAGETSAGEEGALRKQLLAYCERDTLALLEVHRALWALAAAQSSR